MVLRIINETTVVARNTGMENKDNGKTEVNLDEKFEMIRLCAPTRMTTRPFSQELYNDSACVLLHIFENRSCSIGSTGTAS